jgi:hypothetical protein
MNDYDEVIIMRSDFLKMIKDLGLACYEESLGGPFVISNTRGQKIELPYIAARRSQKKNDVHLFVNY